MDKLLQILTDIRPDLDFDTEKELVDGGLLDSFDVISITTEVNEQFGVEINVEDLTADNFNSADAIYALITRRLEG